MSPAAQQIRVSLFSRAIVSARSHFLSVFWAFYRRNDVVSTYFLMVWGIHMVALVQIVWENFLWNKGGCTGRSPVDSRPGAHFSIKCFGRKSLQLNSDRISEVKVSVSHTISLCKRGWMESSRQLYFYGYSPGPPTPGPELDESPFVIGGFVVGLAKIRPDDGVPGPGAAESSLSPENRTSFFFFPFVCACR